MGEDVTVIEPVGIETAAATAALGALQTVIEPVGIETYLVVEEKIIHLQTVIEPVGIETKGRKSHEKKEQLL